MKLIIGGSLFFSVLQSILLWNKAPGISVVLFIIPFLLYFIFFLNKNNKILNKKGLLWSIPIIGLSFTYFIFNNELFEWLNAVVICAFWLIMCIDVTNTELKLKELIINMFNLAAGAFEHIGSVFHGVKEVIKSDEGKEKNKKYQTILKALIITVPVVLIVIILLSSADSIFSNLFSGVGDLLNMLIEDESLPEVLARIITIIMFFSYIAGFMHNIIERKVENKNDIDKKTKKIDAITTEVMLVILNCVYFIFCIIQIIYLFSKAGTPNGMTYAEYARQGFFQLMIVTFINFAILLWVHTKEKNHLNKTQINFVKSMEVFMEICTQIIIISAFYRMFLYEQAYGYTYLRLFVYFILSAEFIFMIFAIIYTIGKRINLVKVGLIIGTVTYMVLNYINVDATIARNNINRYFANTEEEFDFMYLEFNTGTDAVSEIKRLLNTEDEILAKKVKLYLIHKNSQLDQEETWMEFNISRTFARRSLEGIMDEVRKK